MRLDASGNLGLGTVPTRKMDVRDSSNTQSTLLAYNQGASFTGTVYEAITDRTASSDFNLMNLKASTESKFLVRGDGNVGVGTSAPSTKLSVSQVANGNIAAFTNTIDADFFINLTSGVTLLAPSTGVLAFGTGSTERMRLDASGSVLFGTTTEGTTNAYFALESNNRTVLSLGSSATSSSLLAAFKNPNGIVGSISTNGSATSFTTSSDYRLKEDLQDFKGLELVSKIPVYDYKWKAEDSRSYGVMAHELEEVLPQAVTGEKDAKEMQSVDYSKIVPLLVKSIQELSAKLELLECQCKKNK